jgi:hypothetical protein
MGSRRGEEANRGDIISGARPKTGLLEQPLNAWRTHLRVILAPHAFERDEERLPRTSERKAYRAARVELR